MTIFQWACIWIMAIVLGVFISDVIVNKFQTKEQTLSWFEKRPTDEQWTWRGVTIHSKNGTITEFNLLIDDMVVRDAWGKQVELKESPTP